MALVYLVVGLSSDVLVPGCLSSVSSIVSASGGVSITGVGYGYDRNRFLICSFFSASGMGVGSKFGSVVHSGSGLCLIGHGFFNGVMGGVSYKGVFSEGRQEVVGIVYSGYNGSCALFSGCGRKCSTMVTRRSDCALGSGVAFSFGRMCPRPVSICMGVCRSVSCSRFGSSFGDVSCGNCLGSFYGVSVCNVGSGSEGVGVYSSSATWGVV